MRASVYITQKCNFNCLHCLDKCPINKELSYSKFVKLLNNYKFENLFFTGGEPCLHSQFEEIIKETAKRNISFSLVSNGTFLKKYSLLFKYIPLIKKINLSLNGLEKIHDKIRRKGSFSQVLKAIEFYKKNGLDVIINYQVIEGGVNEFEEFIHYMAKIGIKKVRVSAIIRNGFNDALVISINSRKKIYEKLVPYSKKYNLSLTVSPALFSPLGVEMCKVFSDQKNVDVDVNGKFYFCCNLKLNKGIYGTIGDSKQTLLNRKNHLSMKIRDDRMFKILINGFTPETESTCEYCNNFFLSDQK